MKFGAGIHGPHDFGDPLTFHEARPAGQGFHLSSEVFQHFLTRWIGIQYPPSPSTQAPHDTNAIQNGFQHVNLCLTTKTLII